MAEDVLLKSEQPLSREEIATYLQQVVDKLQSGEPIHLESGEQSVTIDPPSRPTFEVKVEREGTPPEYGEMSVEFEIEWKDGDNGNGGLAIE